MGFPLCFCSNNFDSLRSLYYDFANAILNYGTCGRYSYDCPFYLFCGNIMWKIFIIIMNVANSLLDYGHAINNVHY